MAAALGLGLAAAGESDQWSGTDLAVRFGAPLVLLLVGLVIYLMGRTQRRELRVRARRGGFGGPPGTSDIGTAQGFGVEDDAQALRSAGVRVLTGLILMLVGALLLLGAILWRLLS